MSERRSRITLVAVLALLLVLVSVLVALLQPEQEDGEGYLEPDSTRPEGAGAIAEVLRDQGVEVIPEQRYQHLLAAQGSDRTLLVVGSSYLSAEAVERLPDVADRIVLVQPSPATLETLGLRLSTVPARTADPVAAACDWPAAANAGPVELDGDLYRHAAPVSDGLTLCYPVPGAEEGYRTGMIATVRQGSTDYVLLGSDQVLRNDSVSEQGRAAIGLWSLGAHSELVWWNVDLLDPGLGDENTVVDPFDLVPPWWNRAHWWAAAVVLLAILWRARRLGRLVPEPLPVLVRSAETARGRAALYRRVGARDRAAAILRADALRRLARRFGLPPSAPVEQIARLVAERTNLRIDQASWILAGPAPPTDRDLTALVESLDWLLAATDPSTSLGKATT